MRTIVLALQNLSCGRCVSKLKTQLEQVDGVKQVSVNLHFAKVQGDVDQPFLIGCIKQAGYQAQLAQANLHLKLVGLNCGRCVKSVEKVLTELDNAPIFVVTKSDAWFYGKVAAKTAIEAIEKAGFIASLADELTVESSTTEQISQAANNVEQPKLNSELPQQILSLHGITCAACVAKVQKALQAVPQVCYVQVNLAESSALVFGEADSQLLIEAVVKAGYGAELVDDPKTQRDKQQQQIKQEIGKLRRQAGLALILGFGLMLLMMFSGQMQVTAANQLNWGLFSLFMLAVIWLTGGHFYQRAWHNLLNKSATMDTLVALGAGMAWLYSTFVVINPDFFPENARHLYFESSAMIIGLINIGKMLEAKAKRKSSQALQRLLDLTPKTARVIGEQGEYELPLNQVQPNMILRLQTGDRVPVDGVITQGEAWLDESMLTGEPIALFKQKDDKVVAGTLVNDGTLLFKAQQVGKHTRLAQIINLVRQAQSSKPKIGLLVDQISSWFVPIVIVIALIAALIWYVVTQQISYPFVVLTSVLIIACPCALGLATPMSIIAGVGRAAELGILVRDADALQKAAKVNCVVFDKTGTLTQGQPQVTEIFTFNGFEQQNAVQLAASLEKGSNHPLAKAILAYAKDLKLAEPEQFKTHKGLGVSATIEGKNLLLGNQTFLQQNAVATEVAQPDYLSQSQQGATMVFLAVDGQLAALFAISDALREDSQAALQRLAKQGYHLVMLTGDQLTTAQAIAKQLPIDKVIAGVLPEGKAQAIQQLQNQGYRVLMVGDGINDAPALAQADVSIAMGEGSDIAIETAELTLMRQSLHAVADALSLAKGTLHNMKQNLFFAFIYNCLGIPFAAGVFFPLLGILLNPMIGGAAMALSSITVVSNANRLLKFDTNK